MTSTLTRYEDDPELKLLLSFNCSARATTAREIRSEVPARGPRGAPMPLHDCDQLPLNTLTTPNMVPKFARSLHLFILGEAGRSNSHQDLFAVLGSPTGT